MADIFTKAKRSFVMSRIRSRGNKDTELALAKLFRRHKITGWRRQVELRMENYERAGRKFATRNLKFPISRFVLILFLERNGWRCLWTAVSGMVVPSTARSPRATGLFGKINSPATAPAMCW